jgi:hypothetical protein
MGKTFSDTEGRKWTIDVTVATLARVRTLAEVNLLEAIESESKLLDSLSRDPVMLCNVLFAIVKPEADVRSVTDEQFGEALGGDALAEGTEALVQGIIDFFPKARRSLLQRAFDRAKQIVTKKEAMAEAQLEKVLDLAEASLEKPSA